MSMWTDTVEYISKSKSYFTVKDVRNYACDEGSTISQYILYLHMTKYIERVERGMYIRCEEVPTNLKMINVKCLIYKKGLTIEEREDFRKKSVERYWKLKKLKKIINKKIDM